MFKWLFKKANKAKDKVRFYPPEQFIDDIEESLWEIKEQYDLETEEVLQTVASKRENLSYMRKRLKKNRT
jgi:hypothetical protein